MTGSKISIEEFNTLKNSILERYKNSIGNDDNLTKWRLVFDRCDELLMKLPPVKFQNFIESFGVWLMVVQSMHKRDSKSERRPAGKILSTLTSFGFNLTYCKDLDLSETIGPLHISALFEIILFHDFPDEIIVMLDLYLRTVNNHIMALRGSDAPFGKGKRIEEIELITYNLHQLVVVATRFKPNYNRDIVVSDKKKQALIGNDQL